MSIFQSLNTSASALTAQRLRMDVISSNIANAEATRATVNENGEYEPYRRKMVVLETKGQPFSTFLNRASNLHNNHAGNGVRVSEISEDEEPFQLVYNPNHPDAGPDGYVELPNVDPLKEMVDLMSSTRSYEANVTAMNATKSMLLKALEIGK
ncbi:flagellar basal body rod protein FlgC [Aquibacillus koreensis]|uniref:Flagellar basal-body rod protein FlgC n=1 Tax=Aquibacillus koreensis TaxID=279446 RepID=A0A9X3WR51_9BACI|nr:flagellar basal body rod protein FlgC [Aquibacillus koreensis]MCT2534517.1 flagellar basal body rod protein FlgC [Aquibacillus koreensis]MDC3421889.1 flagellar basal body rod protein FlgC [Aquibacillus koreensis]